MTGPLDPNPPIACDLTAFSPAEHRRERELLAWFRSRYARAEESADGWRFVAAADPDVLAALEEFLDLERRCCPFLDFRLEVEADEVIVHVRASPDAKAVVAAEFLR